MKATNQRIIVTTPMHYSTIVFINRQQNWRPQALVKILSGQMPNIQVRTYESLFEGHQRWLVESPWLV